MAGKKRTNTDLKDWTVMIYMAGDNNLSGDMANQLEALNEFRFPGGTARPDLAEVNLFAYLDSGSLTAPTRYMDLSRSDPHDHDVTSRDIITSMKKHKIENGGNPENSASAYSIISFVRWCIEKRGGRANNYVLIFSGHSSGFQASTFMIDRSTGRFLSLRRFRWALETIKNEYLFPDRKDRDRKIAIVGFDSCQMGMLEIGHEIKTVAHTIVASEGNTPNSGWGYGPMLHQFIEHPEHFLIDSEKSPQYLARPGWVLTDEGIKEVAKTFVQQYVKRQQKYAISGNSIDMSAWDLEVISPVAEKTGELGRMLSDMLGLEYLLRDGNITKEGAVIHDATKSLIARSRRNCQSYMHEQAVDLVDFCQQLMLGCVETARLLPGASRKPFNHLQKLCSDLLDAARTCILRTGFSGDEYQYSKGISLFFPWTALTYLFTWRIYSGLEFARSEGVLKDPKNGRKKTIREPGPGLEWDNFLLYYLYIVSLRDCEGIDSFSARFAAVAKGTAIDGDWQQTLTNWRNSRGLKRGTGVNRWPSSSRGDWRSFTRENFPVTGSRENPVTGTKENPPVTGSKENFPVTGTRENFPVTGTRENPLITGTRHNPLITGDKGSGSAAYIEFFGRMRNFRLNWEAKGLWPPE